MSLQAVLTSWGSSRAVQQQRGPSQGWQRYRRSGFRPLLAAASPGDNPEQSIRPQPASGKQQHWASRRVTDSWVMKFWEQRRQGVEAFFLLHGRLPRATAGKLNPFLPGESALGRWIQSQRQHYKGNRQPPLSTEQITALEVTPGWAWEVNFPWEVRRQEVEAFYKQHRMLPRVSAGQASPFLPDEEQLGAWVEEQRQSYRCHRPRLLSAERIEALEATPGWAWEIYSAAWEQSRQEVKAFYQQHGRLPRAKAGKASPFLPGERELGRWVNAQRQHFKGNKQPVLSAERSTALEAIPGWVWDDRLPWELHCQQVQDFVRQHGRLPRAGAGKSKPLLPCEKELGDWCCRQRQRFKGKGERASLSAEQQAALAALPGWYWDLKDDKWKQQR
ncbi:hypothetical protein N2152v2_009716 [Parachlorella kessleri]